MPEPVDPSIWRETGEPLIAGRPGGPLTGLRVAVKDLFALAGHPIGAGVPAYLEAARPEPRTATAVTALLDAGADVAGIARTDEFAYSIAGANPHYGTPPNAAAPGTLPGGSSNGPASAVGLRQADIGLGTDTGGSIRVPASYQGLWGLRTTHGRVPRDGLLPLAPSFDTVGWLTRDAATLQAAWTATRPVVDGEDRPAALALAVDPAALAALDASVQAATADLVDRLAAVGRPVEQVDVGDLEALAAAFRVVQAFEAWQAHGPWLAAHPGAVSGAVAERFRAAAAVEKAEAAAAREVLAAARERLRALLGACTLLLPSSATPAPSIAAPAGEIDRVRMATLRLTVVAGAAGAPAAAGPLLTVDGAPLGLSFVAAPGADAAVLALATELAQLLA
ncbi:MAG TPA: amidase family protein [Amnibacterium sp.]|jgi:Asp-tRNA(Asn)/Glu-tRNA(Gln) amidotransferase A subunit family amidase|uniref:amidase family protein n=1 Tax=Amnibacterium sp. TaxID=1872496 RepID=UPI002F94EE4A